MPLMGQDTVLYEMKFQVTFQRELEFGTWIRVKMDYLQRVQHLSSGSLWRELVSADAAGRFAVFKLLLYFPNLEELDHFLMTYNEALKLEAREKFGIALQTHRWVGTFAHSVLQSQTPAVS